MIESCIPLEPEEGNWTAKRMLAERFGDVFKVSKSWIDKVSSGPIIKPGDREALQQLADDLESCEIALKATGRMLQVNNEDRLVRILERCPGFVKSRWQSRVREIRVEGREPNVQDVRRLVRTASLEKNDPVFGALMDVGGKDIMTKTGGKIQRYATVGLTLQRAMNFSVQSRDENAKDGGKNVNCYYCNNNHKIDSCDDFKKLNGEEMFRFIRAKKLCDNCLSLFHFAAGCKRKHECTMRGCEVKRKHITSMHNAIVGFEQRRNEQPKRITGEDIRDGAHSQKQFVGLTSQTWAGCHTQALPIVPVKVKARGKEKIIETYALLDSRSTATFCSDSLLKRLGLSLKLYSRLQYVNLETEDPML